MRLEQLKCEVIFDMDQMQFQRKSQAQHILTTNQLFQYTLNQVEAIKRVTYEPKIDEGIQIYGLAKAIKMVKYENSEAPQIYDKGTNCYYMLKIRINSYGNIN